MGFQKCVRNCSFIFFFLFLLTSSFFFFLLCFFILYLSVILPLSVPYRRKMYNILDLGNQITEEASSKFAKEDIGEGNFVVFFIKTTEKKMLTNKKIK